MINRKHTIYYISLLLSYLLLAVSLPSQASLTYQDFANSPDVSNMGLSPDGNKIYAKIRIGAGEESGNAIEVTDLTTNKKKIVLFTDNKKYDINWIRWKNNDILLVGVIFPEKRNLVYGGGQLSRKVKTRESRLLIVDINNNKISPVFSKSFLKKFSALPLSQDSVIDTLPDDDEHILMGFYTNNHLFEYGVYKVNITNQKNRVIEDGQRYVTGWKTDQQHRVRILSQYKKGLHSIKIKNIPNNNWRTLWEYETFSEKKVTPMGFAKDPNILFIKAYHNGRLAVFSVDLTDKKLTRKLVISDEKYDIHGGLIYTPNGNKAIGVRYSQKGGYHYFDEEYKKLQTKINKAMPQTNNRIISLSSDEKKYLIYANSDTDSGTFLLGTRAPSSLKVLAFGYKKLTPELMSPIKEYNYQARDGLKIEAFLTLPKEKSKQKLATIIFPHGGPIGRDTDSFNTWAQYLAHKGYAVLQMNFRGSGGQGIDFMKAGFKNWGLQMQDDIQDGAAQLIKEGISDKNKICILGASYGGYAALMGSVKTPDFYQCAISVAGVSNVIDIVRNSRNPTSSYNIVDKQVGDDYEHLYDISPVNHAEEFKIPVLLIHGDSDRQVDITHSQQMRDALLEAKKNVTYVELENEDHYLTNNKNRLITFAAIDKFLTQYLPVK